MFIHESVELTEMDAVTTEKGRKYRTPEGVDLPSITTVLSILSRDSIAKWRKRVGEKEANRISGKAAGRGTRVHEITEKYINNEPNYKEGYTPDIIHSFNVMKPKKREWVKNYFMQEAAYAIMWEERTGQPITQLVTIISVDGKDKPQIYVEHRDNWINTLRDTIKKYNEENSSFKLL